MNAVLVITLALAGRPTEQTHRFEFNTLADCESAKVEVLQADANANALPWPGRQLTWPLPANHVFLRGAHCDRKYGQ
jgi:hypothetical protein